MFSQSSGIFLVICKNGALHRIFNEVSRLIWNIDNQIAVDCPSVKRSILFGRKKYVRKKLTLKELNNWCEQTHKYTNPVPTNKWIHHVKKVRFNKQLHFFTQLLLSVEKTFRKDSIQFSSQSFFLFLKLPMTRRLMRVHIAEPLVHWIIHMFGRHRGQEARVGRFESRCPTLFFSHF